MNFPKPVPLDLTYQLQAKFHLPADTVRLCEKYYILYWEARFVHNQLTNYGTIKRENVLYKPFLSPDITIQKLADNPTLTVRLSFRKLAWKSEGYVLIAALPSRP